MATRTEIRQAVANLAGVVPGVNRAVAYRLSGQVEPEDLPLVMVWIESGSSEPTHSDSYESEAMLNVELWLSSAGDIDAQLDQLMSGIAANLEADDTLDGLVVGLIRDGFSYDRDPDSFTGALVQTFIVTYEDDN